MTQHNVGNQYELLGHILKLEEKYATEDVLHRNRCKLSCRGGCCTRNSGIEMTCHLSDLDGMKCIKEVDPRYHPPGKSEVDWQKGDTAQVQTGWDRAGTMFTVLGPAIFLGQWWVPVEEADYEEDPDFFKEAGLRKVVVNEN